MFKKFTVNNVIGLQVFQVLRFVSFLIISIVFTRSTLSLKDIGDFELLLFLASAVSFFWVTGIIQSLLPLYNNNLSYPHRKHLYREKSPEIFNAFLLLTIFSAIIAIMFYLLRGGWQVYKGGEEIPHADLIILYIFLSNPVSLIEYIYLLYKKPVHILWYGFIVFVAQVLLVVYPVLLNYGVRVGIWGLIIITLIRFIWLLILLRKYAVWKVSFKFMREHISLATPLIISTLLSGSAQYVDGIIVSAHFSPDKFAQFRFGAKEMPLVVMLASGLNNAMLPEFRSAEKVKQSLAVLKKKSARLMHILFPISILLLFYSNNIFPALFTKRFNLSADIFMVYLLLITSRLLFPQTILIGLKKTKVVMTTAVMEIILNIALTLALIPAYGMTGVALATIIIFFVEKMVLMGYNYRKLGIKPWEYTPVGLYLFYSLLILTLFVLIDHRIIMVRP